ncbi:MAG: hypothetical protein COW18_01230 [Zetaproteobacteria bacterium CG12_big_fil_rev_8_21_14_0_65_54_13]|nr:MAG: hypothetical protein COW18_01230 [Zetaproteobacteria bacterium CG12_big_fil_rev_8_21_14_0_65_54_13]PIX55743.1 MAG: hypothetical protein COZ50_01220 [Zetaproteobacteria bacterium CG_4_10_14_3_um_filter_54_28]PJA30555.1 MAG: hypothetical protein CO188_03130 [Zetaproteobacteria bacterium CG_4_9_14_3_um_filter_54_145]
MEALNTLHLLRPLWLLALPLWLLLVYGLWRSERRANGWPALCDPALLKYLVGETQRQVRSRLLPATLLFGGILLIVAMAGPVWQALPQPVYRAQSGMIIVLDLSRSMDAGDLKPSRLKRARQKVQDVLRARVEGQTGLIVFAGSAFDVVPMTTDNKAILTLLSSLDTSMMPVQGSRASAGLKRAELMLKRGAISHGSVVMLTDGVDGDAEAAALQLAAAGHRLSIIGVGTAEGAPIALAAGGFLKDKQGNIVMPRLHEDRLAALASAGGGIYQRLRADDVDVKRLPGLHPDQSRSESKSSMHTDQWREEGPWLVLLVLPLLLLVFRRGVLLLLLLVPLAMPDSAEAMAWNDLWQTPDQQGQALLQAGKAEEAATHFQAPEWKGAAQYRAGAFKQAAKTMAATDTADGWYNRANALARAGQLQQAIAAFDQALKRQPSHADAAFNRDIVQKLLKQKQKQDKQKQSKQGKNDKQQNKPEQSTQDKQDQDRSDQKQGSDSKQQGKPGGDQQQQGSAQQSADQQQGGNAQAEEQSGGQKPAGKSSQQSPQQQQSDDTTAQPGQQADSKQAEANKAAQPATNGQKPAAEKGDQQQSAAPATDAKSMEDDAARRQWLRRIPDDPGGLLRRKFHYQYQQQGNQSAEGQAW